MKLNPEQRAVVEEIEQRTHERGGGGVLLTRGTLRWICGRLLEADRDGEPRGHARAVCWESLLVGVCGGYLAGVAVEALLRGGF